MSSENDNDYVDEGGSFFKDMLQRMPLGDLQEMQALVNDFEPSDGEDADRDENSGCADDEEINQILEGIKDMNMIDRNESDTDDDAMDDPSKRDIYLEKRRSNKKDKERVALEKKLAESDANLDALIESKLCHCRNRSQPCFRAAINNGKVIVSDLEETMRTNRHFMVSLKLEENRRMIIQSIRQTIHHPIPVDGRVTYTYNIGNRVVCSNVFMAYLNVKPTTFKTLQAIAREGGMDWTHGRTGMTFDHGYCRANATRTTVKRFLKRFGSIHGLPMPGGVSVKEMTLLPASYTKQGIWELFCKASEGDCSQIKIQQFVHIWKEVSPRLKIMSPRTDVCETCFVFREALQTPRVRINRQLQQKILAEWTEHKELAKKSRDSYRQMVNLAIVKENQRQLAGGLTVERPYLGVYSFDFAQNVYMPFNFEQPGPVYFKSMFQVYIFGMTCEAEMRQLNFLFSEREKVNKGGNCVCSLIHKGFMKFGRNEKHRIAWCDNCAGQNKNKTIMWYLLLCVILGICETFELRMMLVGHTKFSPDAYFGLLKRKFCKSVIHSLEELQDCVNSSAVGNEALLYHDQTHSSPGVQNWKWYNWTDFLADFFEAPTDVTNYQTFKACASRPGVLFCRKHTFDDPNDEWVEMQLLKTKHLPGCKTISKPSSSWGPAKIADRNAQIDQMHANREAAAKEIAKKMKQDGINGSNLMNPGVEEPPSLSSFRQWYLYEEIRPRSKPQFQNRYYPMPGTDVIKPKNYDEAREEKKEKKEKRNQELQQIKKRKNAERVIAMSQQ